MFLCHDRPRTRLGCKYQRRLPAPHRATYPLTHSNTSSSISGRSVYQDKASLEHICAMCVTAVRERGKTWVAQKPLSARSRDPKTRLSLYLIACTLVLCPKTISDWSPNPAEWARSKEMSVRAGVRRPISSTYVCRDVWVRQDVRGHICLGEKGVF